MSNSAVRLILAASLALAGCSALGVTEREYVIGDLVWDDLDQDGIQDPEEPGVEGVRVFLYRQPDGESKGVIAETRTDARGEYFFPVSELDIINAEFIVEFEPPSSYSFTLMDQGNDDAKDSDADPATGFTIPFRVPVREEEVTTLDPWDAGLVFSFQPPSTPTPSATPEPVLTPTFTPTPPSISTMPLSYTTFPDGGDARDCSTNSAVDDPEVDIAKVDLGVTPDNNFWLRTTMGAPLVNDFSFAIVILIFSPDGVQSMLWEVHDGVNRIGMRDPNTRQLLEEQPEGLFIVHDLETGEIVFMLPLSVLFPKTNRLEINAFHLGMEGDSVHCDTLDINDIPDEILQ
ncbi:MAG: hypothetical protein HYZ26_03960 [Chloroflexi bacterium]|nr:hypothetical protein [Chloroflexota bacterium]